MKKYITIIGEDEFKKNFCNPFKSKKAYKEVYNNSKGDNREDYYLTKEQVERLKELGSIMVLKNQRKIIGIDHSNGVDRTCKVEGEMKDGVLVINKIDYEG